MATESQNFSKVHYVLFSIPELTFTDIIVHSVIYRYAQTQGFCNATNAKILEKLNGKISNTTLKRSISTLQRLKLISVVSQVHKDSKFYTQRKIFPTPISQIETNLKPPMVQPFSSPVVQPQLTNGLTLDHQWCL